MLALAGLVAFAPAAHAGPQAADCAKTDPQNLEEVYACMSSYRVTPGQNLFESSIGTSDCLAIRLIYKSALFASGIPYKSAEALVPQCDLLARAAEEFTGSKPFWEQCLGFGEKPLQEHMSACISAVLAGYRGAPRAAGRLKGCGNVILAYEAGLRAADARRDLPAGYSRPDCVLAADVLASLGGAGAGAGQAAEQPGRAWGPCMNYDPAHVEQHLAACLGQGPGLAKLQDCRDVRRAYEARLVEANAGLPPGYIALPCSSAENILGLAAAERKRIEEARREEARIAAARMEEARRSKQARIQAQRQTPAGSAAGPSSSEPSIWPALAPVAGGFAAMAAFYRVLPRLQRRMEPDGESALARALALGGHGVAAVIAAAGALLLGKDFLIGAVIGAAFMVMAQAVLLPRG